MNGREERDLLAAEYVLGVLSAAEAETFERRLAVEPDLRPLVKRWSQRLMGLTDVPEAIRPNAFLWQRIEADLERMAAERAEPLPVRRRLDDRLWSSLAFWRWSAATGAIAAVAMAAISSFFPIAQRTPVAVTVLEAEDGTARWVVQAYSDSTLQVTPLTPITVTQEQALELWTLRDPAEGPISLGLVPVDGVLELPIEDLPLPSPGQLFEVSLEGAQGSPIGRPTGPVLGVGNAAGI